ncbi:aldo/keto reductase [Billgrantia antri]|uniref:aldo/keto reductase n=1 Tax=Billgrantia antri TaxID=2846777 RepID=UPI00308426CD
MTSAVTDTAQLAENDVRRGLPRFSTLNLPHNLRELEKLQAIAGNQGVTTGQLALAWLKAQGGDVIPIPGSRFIAHMRKNLAAEDPRLDAATLERLNALLTPDQVAGARYSEALQA